MFAIGGILGWLTLTSIASGIMAVGSWFLFNALVPEINHLMANIRAAIFSLVWAVFEALLTVTGMKRFARKWRNRLAALEKKD